MRAAIGRRWSLLGLCLTALAACGGDDDDGDDDVSVVDAADAPGPDGADAAADGPLPCLVMPSYANLSMATATLETDQDDPDKSLLVLEGNLDLNARPDKL